MYFLFFWRFDYWVGFRPSLSVVHTPVQLVAIVPLKVGCQPPYKIHRRRSELTNNNNNDPMWSSDTASPNPHRLCMQDNCNLVMYTEKDMCLIHLKDSNTLVLQKDGVDIWSSKDSHGIT
uniref:Bulb-type lectin domain-containing protein n=1 Tax=Oncorhynchus tshawytscha TaxID=74940 RepID=A0A8C8GYZ2_ONCTS